MKMDISIENKSLVIGGPEALFNKLDDDDDSDNDDDDNTEPSEDSDW